MTRRVRIAIAAVAVLLALPVLAGAGFVAFFDPNSLRGLIQDQVKRATGRELTLGRLGLAWSLAPRIEVDDVRLANAPGGSEPDMVRLAHVEARIRLLPLLWRRIEVASLRVTAPVLLLEVDRDGRGNWQFQPDLPPPAASAPSQGGTRTRFDLDVATIQAEGGTLRLRDARSGRDLLLGIPQLALNSGLASASGMAELVLDGRTLALRTETGPLARLLAPPAAAQANGAWPLRAVLSGPGLSLTADGTLADPRDLAGAELKLDATASDLSALVPALPLRGARGSVRISGSRLSDIVLHAEAADLAGLLPGLRLRSLELSAPALGQAARLDVSGTLNDAPVQATASVLPTPNGSGVVLRGLRLASPLGDLAGDLAIPVRPRLALRGSLVSQRVDADAVRALLRPRAEPPGPAAADTGSQTPAPPGGDAAARRVIPDIPLPLDQLVRLDVDLRWTVATLILGGAEWHDLAAYAVLRDGRLRLDPFSATAPGGRVEATLAADASQAAAPMAVTLRAPQVAIGPLAALLGQPDAASGTAELQLDLRGTGRSLRPVLAGLDGTALLTLVDGDLDLRLLAPLLGRVAPGSSLAGAMAGRSRARCVAVRAEVQHGTVQLRSLFLDSSRLGLDGQGTLNLADETMDLHLRPVLRIGGAGISTPVRVLGSFSAIRPQLDAIQPGRVGAVIGGLAPAEDGCGPALASARDGRPGPMPGPMPAAADASRRNAPADLLRRLLR